MRHLQLQHLGLQQENPTSNILGEAGQGQTVVVSGEVPIDPNQGRETLIKQVIPKKTPINHMTVLLYHLTTLLPGIREEEDEEATAAAIMIVGPRVRGG